MAATGTGLARGAIGRDRPRRAGLPCICGYMRHPERRPEMKKVFADDALPPLANP